MTVLYCGLLYTGEKMYVARGASSKLPGYISSSDQKFSYYHPGVDLYYGEDHQILTCKIPGAYIWRPFILNFEHNLDHKGVFVDYTNRFLIAQFHSPIDSINTEEIQKVANFKDPILGFLEYKRNPHSSMLNKVVAFCMGKAYDINYLTLHNLNLAEKVSYLSIYSVPQLSHFAYPQMKWAEASKLRIPENAVCSSISSSGGAFYISWSSSASNSNAIKFFSQRVVLDLHPTRIGYGNCYRKYKVLVADDPDAFQWKSFPETDELRNRDSCDSNMSWSIGDILIKHRKDDFDLSLNFNVLIEEASGKAYILTKTCSPHSLQDLCRNVIVTSTLGIPKSIDCLPLPISIKEYCKLLIS